jgi:hypothetical protein
MYTPNYIFSDWIVKRNPASRKMQNQQNIFPYTVGSRSLACYVPAMSPPPPLSFYFIAADPDALRCGVVSQVEFLHVQEVEL